MTFKDATGATDNLPAEEMHRIIQGFPALLWRIEISRSRITFLNAHPITALGDSDRLFLKSRDHRKTAVLPEDMSLVDGFMDAVRDGRPASTVFRVHSEGGEVAWLKLSGRVMAGDPRYFYGYLLDVSDAVDVIKSIIDKDLELKLMIEDAESPSLLADFETRKVLALNGSARELFGAAEGQLAGTPLSSVLRGGLRGPFERALDDIPFSRNWSGKLDWQGRGGSTITAETVTRYLIHDGHPVLRFTLRTPQVHVPAAHLPEPERTDGLDLTDKLEGITDIGEILRTSVHSPLAAGSEGILFSDIHIRRNKVVVWGCGKGVEDIHGETYAFKGTIAEDIEKFALSHMIVDDTRESIKPIDWTLFVPKGIVSYFARPFHVRGTLRTVLILFSTRPGAFEGKRAEDFDSLFIPVERAIRGWRRACRMPGSRQS